MFDSDEELYFSWWLDELKSKGYVEEWQKCEEPFVICESSSLPFFFEGKKKLLKKEVHLFQGKSYTPDFKIKWLPKALGVFVMMSSIPTDSRKEFIAIDYTSFVDIKGSYFGKHVSDILFSMKQAMVYEKHGVYVQKITPLSSSKKKGLFEKTFGPSKLTYKVGPKKGQMKHGYLTLDEYEKQLAGKLE